MKVHWKSIKINAESRKNEGRESSAADWQAAYLSGTRPGGFNTAKYADLHFPVYGFPRALMIAVQSPVYFPDLAYMALILEADDFVMADTFPYKRRTMQNRSRLRTPQGWQWISVPLRGGQRGRPIDAVRIENRERWLVKHWRSFQYNYRSTPYFELYEPELEPFFTRTWTHLGALTCASIKLLCSLMRVPTRLRRASALPGRPASVRAVQEATGFDEAGLVVPAGGGEASQAQAVLHVDGPTYRQNFDGFEPDMSAADLVFNVGPEAARVIREAARAESLRV